MITLRPMRPPTFTIVIPTRNRADVLRSAIQTAVNQSDKDFQVLVSDNASSDDTPAMVESFGTAVRYINPGRPLGMSEHWEFALAHVEPGFVTVLGDDDGLLPNAVAKARRLLAEHDAKAVAWRKAEYHWPDHIIASYRDWLQVPFGDVRVADSQEVLKGVASFKRTYTDLPCIYNSFISTVLLEELKRLTAGRLLPCVTPDIYSGVAVANLIERYVFSGSPLSVNAASRHSNGTLASFTGVNTPATAEHFSTTSEKVHRRLVPSSSVPILIADALLSARDHLNFVKSWPEMDWLAMFELALRYAERRPPTVMSETLAALDRIAHRNHLTAEWSSIRSTAVQQELPPLQPFGWDESATYLAINGREMGVRNVADASLLTSAVVCAVQDAKTAPERIQCLPNELDPMVSSAWGRFLLALQRPQPRRRQPSAWQRLRGAVRNVLRSSRA